MEHDRPWAILTTQLVIAIEAARVQTPRPLIIGIDGPDCAGKTTLSRELLRHFMAHKRVLLVHADDYLHAKDYREQRGEFSVEGFLLDYFDQEAIARGVLEPMTDASAGVRPDLVILEGMFLYRPPLSAHFGYRIRMEIAEDHVLERALKRDVGVIGDEPWVREHYTRQCIPAQRIYRQEADPAGQADVVITIGRDGFELDGRAIG